MRKQLKNKQELFDYLMYGYVYELEDVQTKKGIQKRLKDNELEQELKNKTKENIKVKNLFVELKLGPSYNRTENPWIQIYTIENKSGTKGRYIGISFSKETNEIELWLGFGRTSKKQNEVFEQAKELKIKYSLIETNLKNGFEYKEDCYDAVFIEKKINIKDFKEEEFEKDLEYISELYKEYEMKFENATILPSKNKTSATTTKQITYEEINEKMLMLIEEVGNLAKTLRELKQE